jgi:hypothetical protein
MAESAVREIQGPPSFDDFQAGDHVAHITLGDGEVSAVDSAHVHVTYADRRGVRAKGSYDRRWFVLCPRYLFHRNVTVI